MSSVILSYNIISTLISTRQLQESYTLYVDYATLLHFVSPCSPNTFNLPLSALSAFPHSRSNRTLVFILPPTLHHIFFLVIIQHNNHYYPISNSINNFQPLSPSSRHPYFTYPVLLFFQTSCATFNVERQRFMVPVGFPWLDNS